jgi:hypothetical protein
MKDVPDTSKKGRRHYEGDDRQTPARQGNGLLQLEQTVGVERPAHLPETC